MIKARTPKRTGRRVYDVRLRDLDGKEYSRTFPTKRAAELLGVLRRRSTGLLARRLGRPYVAPTRLSASSAERWLAANRRSRRPNTLATDLALACGRIWRFWADRRIGSVTPRGGQGLVNSWSPSEAAGPLRRQCKMLALRQPNAYAVERGPAGPLAVSGDRPSPQIRAARRMKLTPAGEPRSPALTSPPYRCDGGWPPSWAGGGRKVTGPGGIITATSDLLAATAWVAATNNPATTAGGPW